MISAGLEQRSTANRDVQIKTELGEARGKTSEQLGKAEHSLQQYGLHQPCPTLCKVPSEKQDRLGGGVSD